MFVLSSLFSGCAPLDFMWLKKKVRGSVPRFFLQFTQWWGRSAHISMNRSFSPVVLWLFFHGFLFMARRFWLQ